MSSEIPAPDKRNRGPEGARDAGDVVINAGLSPENAARVEALATPKKNFFVKAYEKISNLPVVKRVVGKIELAYNQRLADRYQEKSAVLKQKMDQLAVSAGGLQSARAEMEAVIADLRRDGLPGADLLEVRLGAIDKQRDRLLAERDGVQSDFEAADNRAKLHINKRDRIADRFIDDYDARLQPIETEIRKLHGMGSRAQEAIVAAEAQHRIHLRRVTEIESAKARIEAALRLSGKTDAQISKDPAIQSLDASVATIRDNIRDQREALAKRRDAINERIADTDARANPYRDKREAFIRIKAGRPVQIDVAPRTRGPVFRGTETVRSNSREGDMPLGDEFTDPSMEEGYNPEFPSTDHFIGEWNRYVNELLSPVYNSLDYLITSADRNILIGARGDLESVALSTLRPLMESVLASKGHSNMEVEAIINSFLSSFATRS